MTLRRLWAAVALASTVSCSTAAVVSNTNNIVRASDVEFLCLRVDTNDVTTGEVHPMSDCGLNSDNSPASADLHVHALVLQSDRGELGLIDLATTTGFALFDNSPGVPGFSFIPVGPLPSAIVTDVRGAGNGSVWVASAGGRQIVRVDGNSLRKDPRRNADAQTRTTIDLDGVPHDLAIDTVGGRRQMYATFPDQGSVAVYDITDATHPNRVAVIPLGAAGGDLDGGGPDAGDATVGEAGVTARARPYALAVDPDTHTVYVSDETRSVVHAIDATAMTESSTLDFGAPTRSLVVTAVARARGDGRYCPGPTDVPDPDHCARGRYLYATTVPSGDVRVWDITRGALVRPNVLPQPNARGQRIDPSRPAEVIPLRAPVTALVGIATTDYNADDPDSPNIARAQRCDLYPCSGQGTDPAQLHGVFVGAVQRDGNLVIIDVDDYTAPCRETRCGASAAVPVYRFVRHAPRALTALTTAPALAAVPSRVTPVSTGGVANLEGRSAPEISCADSRTVSGESACAATNNYGVDLTRSPRGVALAEAVAAGVDPPPPAVHFSSETLRQSTDPMSPLLYPAVSSVDPYVARNEAWTFVWEGVLPGLDQAGGALSSDGDAVVLDAPGAAFCARGALGDEANHDLVTLVSDPAASTTDDQSLCTEVFGSGTGPLNRDFVIRRAAQGRLTLDLPTGLLAAPGGASIVPRCFPQATRFQVRARQQWIVQGSRAAYRHAVRANADGLCEVDPTAQTESDAWVAACRANRNLPAGMPTCPVGRACMGAVTGDGVTRATTPVFANEWLCLQIFPGLQGQAGQVTAALVDRDTLLSFSITGAFEPFAALTGALPLTARALTRVDRLFVVDTAINGLVEFALNPFARGRTFN